MARSLARLSFSIFALSVSPLLLTGCQSGPGRGFSLLPSQGHKLTDSAKEARDVNTQALMVPRELEKQPQPEYVVEPGDVLLIQPADLDSPVRLPADQPVLPDGTINLGKYGHLQVMSKTVPEIEGIVRSAVAAKTKDAGFISVRLVSRQSKVFYVIGEVNSPGKFQLNGNETVLDALLQAGGLTDKASRDNIILTRPSKPNCPRMVLPVCWKGIVQIGDTTTNYQITAGDRVYVPSRSAWTSILPKHEKSPCTSCNSQTPQQFPPYPGSSCQIQANSFFGYLESAPPPSAIPPSPPPPTPK
jgi:polysaccharide export outer membrane protein